ncbi:MAG: hypothetical protein WCD89_13290 [Anaerocolumna sp.]
MKQIWLLTKVQISTVFDFGNFLKNKKTAKKNSYIFTALTLFFLVMFSVMSFLYSYAMGTSLKKIGMLELLPELLMAVTCVITIITTIYKVKGTLFGFKDYDLIMSLPVKTSMVVTSRLLLLNIINITFTLIIMVPAAIVYGILSTASINFYAVSLLTVLFIPIIPMIAASIIGTIITVIASKFRHSNLVNLIITFAFLIGIMIFPYMAGDSEEALGQMTAVITKQVDNIYPLAGMYRRAVCDLNVLSIVLFLLISIIAFALFSFIVGIKFKTINTNIAASRTKANYKIGNLEQASPFMALYRKELRRFFSSSLYIMNTAIGMVMMTIGAIATLFMSPQALAQVMEVPQMAGYAGAFAPLLVSMCVAMTYITACSISLEGKNLWILKASPVLARTIFLSKISVSLTITLPAILADGILIAIGLKLSFAEFLVLLVMPTVYALFTAIFGLIINLALPKLNWSTEVTVIKQSAASMIAIFGGILVVALPMVLMFVLSGIEALYLNILSTLVILAVTVFLYRYLNTKGEKTFRAL